MRKSPYEITRAFHNTDDRNVEEQVLDGPLECVRERHGRRVAVVAAEPPRHAIAHKKFDVEILCAVGVESRIALDEIG
jgi:hypothetical protein